MGVMAAWRSQAAITPINQYYALLLFIARFNRYKRLLAIRILEEALTL